MKNSYKSILLWGMLAITCIILLSRPAYAEEMVTGYNGGPGVEFSQSGSIVAKDMEDVEESAVNSEQEEIISDIPEAVSAETNESSADDKVYIHDDVKYVKGDSWGEHKLTGYSREKNGDKLYSGREARAKHTIAASSELPTGTVIIVERIKGPNHSDFDGVYVVEDRGGKAIEGGMLDIFFETDREARSVTHKGWNVAQVWIAKKVD